MRGAYAGTLGELMQRKAHQWSNETPNPKNLPERATKKKSRRKKKPII
jgi:hypothetical protein